MTPARASAGGPSRTFADAVWRASVALAVLVMVGACGGSPEVPLGPDGEPDAVLVQGREVYGANCATCHGREGQGGRGKRINDGRVLAAYPEIEDLVAVIANGKGAGMPAFGEKLSDQDRNAVARYVREVLN